MRWMWLAATAAWAGCAGPPLPADPQAIEAELRARAEIVRDAFPSLEADGSIVIDGPERLKQTWRFEAVRGRWARVSFSSALAPEPVVDVLVRADDGVAVRISPPGGTAMLYTAPSGDLSALAVDGPTSAAAQWLAQLARGENVAMPSPSGIQVSDGAVRLDFTREPLVSRVTLRRSDGMPLHIEAWMRGAQGRGCVVARGRGDRALRVGSTALSLVADLESAVVPCCGGEALLSIRLTIAHVASGAPTQPPRWAEPARAIERIREDRWAGRVLRQVDVVREKMARACPADR